MSTDSSLLLVHGRGFKPQAKTLHDLSIAAIRGGIERDFPELLDKFNTLRTDLAWYGDLNAEVLTSMGHHYDESLDVSDRHTALAALQKIPTRKKFGIRCYDSLPGKSALPEFCVSFVAPFFAAIGLSRLLVYLVAKDTSQYLKPGDDYGASVRDRLREKLCAKLDSGERVVLISHGTGTLVAHDVLWQLSHHSDFAEQYADKKVDLWITLGSPLGDSGIKKRLLGAKQPAEVRYPTNVITWHNVSAEDDYTCHDNTLADDYRWMLKSRRISAIHDHKVFNCAVRYGKSNPHSSLGYLIHPRVTKIVSDWLCTDAVTTNNP